MDHEIIKNLFSICIEASEILDTDREFADTLRKIMSDIAPGQVVRFGQLQEWMEDIDDPQTGTGMFRIYGEYSREKRSTSPKLLN